MVDTLWKNVAGYVGWGLLAVMVNDLQELHRQLTNGQPLDGWAVLDATIQGVLPVLIVMLGTMKQPSIGHETVAARVEDHEERLRVSDPPARSGDV